MTNQKRTMINLFCSIIAIMTNAFVSFFMSPYIVEHIGVEANGFITLATNFVTYAQLIVTALNSMAARFITIEYINKDYRKANLYYNSVFWGNLLIVCILIIPAVYLIYKLDTLMDVPQNILFDVKLLFLFVFLNFFIATGLPNWDCGTYVSNRLDRSYIPQVLTSLGRCLFLIIIFSNTYPYVWYVGLSSLLANSICLGINGYNTHILTPQLKIYYGKNSVLCSWKAIKELITSGIWSTISNIGSLFLTGLDLIICNKALGANAMGILSLSKVLPLYMQHFSTYIRNAFAPELTICYAEGDKEALLNIIKKSMKITSIVMTVPIAGIVVLGGDFFKLWVPTQNAELLHLLSVLAILGYMFTSGTQILYNVFSTVNKVRSNAIAMLLSGFVSVSLTMIIVYFTDYDIYAVAGISTFVNLVRNMVFTVPITAKYLGFKWYQFFSQVCITVISSICLILTGYVIKPVLRCNTWSEFFISAFILGSIGLIINSMLILNKDERRKLKEIIKRKWKV